MNDDTETNDTETNDGTFVAPLPPSLLAAARLLIEGLPDTEVTDERADALHALEALLRAEGRDVVPTGGRG